METLFKLIHVLVSVFLILVVLLQAGRGGGMGAAFGGASAQIFGGRGASNFLSRVTSVLAIVFFLTSLTLSMMSSQHQSVMRDRTGLETPAAQGADSGQTPDSSSAADARKDGPNDETSESMPAP